MTYKVVNRSPHTLSEYTSNDFKEHREALREFEEQDFEERAAAASRCIDLILRAAGRRKDATVLAILTDFEQFITKIFETYQLSPQLEGLLREWPASGPEIKVDRHLKSFPIAPLSTAWSFPTPREAAER